MINSKQIYNRMIEQLLRNYDKRLYNLRKEVEQYVLFLSCDNYVGVISIGFSINCSDDFKAI